MIVRNNIVGFGNDGYCTMLIRGNAPIVDANPDTTLVPAATGGKIHLGVGILDDTIKNITGVFDKAYSYVYGDSAYSSIIFSSTDNQLDWMGIRNVDFTIDFWLYRNGYGTGVGHTGIFECIDGSPYGFSFYDDFATNKLTFDITNAFTSVTLTTLIALPLDTTFRHVAVCREGDDCYLFLDGIEQDTDNTVVSATPASDDQLAIFYNNKNVSSLDCAISDIRISTGIARWTSSFTIPDRAY